MTDAEREAYHAMLEGHPWRDYLTETAVTVSWVLAISLVVTVLDCL